MGLLCFPHDSITNAHILNPIIVYKIRLKKTSSNYNVLGNFHRPPSCDHRHRKCLQFPLKSRHTDTERGLLLVPSNANNSGGLSGYDDDDDDNDDVKEDPRALGTVLKLYTAIKNKNIRELSEIIGNECLYVCNLFSTFHPLRGKKQVLDFFSYLIRSLGNKIEFVVTPTLHDGMNVGIQWSLEWKQTHAPLGKGFSFDICQVYKGKMIIRNVEMFMEPLLHVEPLRLKMMEIMTGVMDKIGMKEVFKGKANKIVLALLFLCFKAAVLVFLKFILHKA